MVRFSPLTALPLALLLCVGALSSAALGTVSRPLGWVAGLGFGSAGALVGLGLALSGLVRQRVLRR
ncbi:hypothetical protein FGE12_22520 [Aggregicoccus sp. 17bor-14]|uniref:hypothetical protein n=1 Tax=Myxococcaceae TaxID=31 RepID=UPI00129C5B28|nr:MULTISPECIES: hypothetical protein [Myxococcaceae]MBF5045196.1 hypothetical protein [Simulacricoccus sp. 17bor-14]MRI90937.1 hypothetical protein [Aggregicoccus sp. 17bor-14]